MTSSEIAQLLAAIGIVGALLWSLARWDERRMNRALKMKYPDQAMGEQSHRLLTWDEKKSSLEEQLKRAHATTDTQDFIPYVGVMVAMALGYRFLGWIGSLLAIPFGVAVFYLIRAWFNRGRAKAARALLDWQTMMNWCGQSRRSTSATCASVQPRNPTI